MDGIAEKIHEALKKAGFSRRQVSIRERGILNSTFRLTVHDPNVSILEIRKLTDKFKEIERDRNGDLMSGNTYIIINRNNDRPVIAEQFRSKVKEALQQVLAEPDGSWKNIPIEVNGRKYYLNKQGGHRPNLSGPRADYFDQNTGKNIVGSQGMKQVFNPSDKKSDDSYEIAFMEAEREIAMRIQENELDISYIQRMASNVQNEVKS